MAATLDDDSGIDHTIALQHTVAKLSTHGRLNFRRPSQHILPATKPSNALEPIPGYPPRVDAALLHIRAASSMPPNVPSANSATLLPLLQATNPPHYMNFEASMLRSQP